MTNMIVYAIHNFEAENEDEINFLIGEPITVLEKDEKYLDGWWQVSKKETCISWLYGKGAYKQKNIIKPGTKYQWRDRSLSYELYFSRETHPSTTTTY